MSERVELELTFFQTSEEHCGDKRVQRPSCSKEAGNARVVGHYEAWAANRQCNPFRPEQIPTPLYTHINFAYANIDPETFRVVPGARSDISLFKRLVQLKNIDPQLKVYISIGGQDSDDESGAVGATFSQLAASVEHQKVFIESLISFTTTWGFDGVNIEWYHPGREDYDNYSQLASRIRQSFRVSNKGLTITTPASYHHLRNYDLRALAPSVEWFNVR